MGDTTVVDTAALAAAGRSSSQRSRDVLDAVGASTTSLARLATELAGAQCTAEVVTLRRAVEGALTEVGGALDRLGRLLSAAAGQYAQAEDWASRSMAAAPSPGAGPPVVGPPVVGPGPVTAGGGSAS